MTDVPDIPAFLDRRKPKPFVATYSNLSCYEDVCPYQFYRRYILKDIPFTETVYTKAGNEMHTAFEHRIQGGKPFPDNMRHFEKFAATTDGLPGQVEMRVAVTRDGKPCDWWHNDVRLRGKIDWFAINGSFAFILDWKLANSKYEKPYELEIHAMMLKARYPQLEKVEGAYVWLKPEDMRLGQRYDLSDFNSTWARIGNIVERIEDDIASGEFEKRRGPLCDWCDVIDCEHNKKHA